MASKYAQSITKYTKYSVYFKMYTSPDKLKIHTRCVHSREKETLMEKYNNTKHYWETGKIGISYQSFLESRFLIDACLPQKSN